MLGRWSSETLLHLMYYLLSGAHKLRLAKRLGHALWKMPDDSGAGNKERSARRKKECRVVEAQYGSYCIPHPDISTRPHDGKAPNHTGISVMLVEHNIAVVLLVVMETPIKT